jgi:hypothetical protein
MLGWILAIREPFPPVRLTALPGIDGRMSIAHHRIQSSLPVEHVYMYGMFTSG